MSRTRTRRIAKWVGLGLCVFIVALWGVSLFRIMRYANSRGQFVALGGTAFAFGWMGLFDPLTDSGWYLEIVSPGIVWMPQYFSMLPPRWMVILPIWLPLLAIAIPTVWLWRRDRRHPPGHCQRCGYDLTGNVTGVCSECEEPISTERTQ